MRAEAGALVDPAGPSYVAGVRRADSPSVLVARSQVRTRLRSLLLLGALAGITAGLVMATLSGAIRTDSALDRFRERENAADAVVFASQVDAGPHPDWSQLEARPEVSAVAPWGLAFGTFDAGGPPRLTPGPTLLFAAMDDRYLGEMGRPIVVEGRLFDPEADDEAVIDENVHEVEVGDVIPFTAYSPDQVPFSGEAEGPHIDVRVVGRVKTVSQFLFVPDGQGFVGPGLVAEHGDEMLIAENADVQLRHGAADLAALQRAVDEVVAPGTPVLDLHAAARRVETTTSVEHTALLVLTGVVLLAGLALVGQAVVQSAAATTDDRTALTAVGMTSRSITATAVLVHLPTAITAAVTAAATAVIASLWFPIGMAGQLDPDRGIQPMWAILVPGTLLVAGAVLAGAAVTARSNRPALARAGSPSRALTGIRRVASVPVGLGTTMALGPGEGRARIPARQALIGAVVGVLGVVATVTLNAGLEDALNHPERAGVAWDAGGIVAGDPSHPAAVDPELIEAIAATDGVATVAAIDRQVMPVNGVGVPTFAVRPPPGAAEAAIQLVLTSGQAPSGPDEAAIGPASAADLDVGVGDEVTIGATDHRVTIVGEALFPSDVHATFDQGLWLDAEGFDAAAPPEEIPVDDPVERQVAFDIADDASAEEVLDSLQTSVGDQFEDFGPAVPPVELTNLENVRTLPRLLAGFLALLAVGALGHVLATSARRRGKDFAVLRALGLTRWDSRIVLNVQGTAIGLVGLIVGIPAGIVLGRLGWAVVAESVPLAVVRPVAAFAVLALVPLALLVANGLAVWPGRRVARLRPAEVLRTE